LSYNPLIQDLQLEEHLVYKNMVGVNDIVITGIGCVTPIGIGKNAFWESLTQQRCAIRRLHVTHDDQHIAFFGARVDDFDARQYVTPRKALKVMGREVQMAYSAAHLAWQDACLTDAKLTPQRMGVVYGSEMIPGEVESIAGAVRACSKRDANGERIMDYSAWGKQFSRQIYPLWMLQNLPNMPACHVGIAIDARGPNNTIAQEEVSGLLALSEAAQIIQRGDADLMVVGSVGERVTPTRLLYRATRLYHQRALAADEILSHNGEYPCLPFDARRRGIVSSEGATAMIIESRAHAVRRGARILAVLSGYSSRYARPLSTYQGSRKSILSAAQAALDEAQVDSQDLAHVGAQGYSAAQLDIEEAAAIAQVAADVPVTAFSSYFGTAGAGCGLMELAASMLAVQHGVTLPTLGYNHPDANCPINVSNTRQETSRDALLKLSYTPHGQAAAVVVRCMK
jgi:3-oxoacyl-[acyl-carrier-protein] synthase II